MGYLMKKTLKILCSREIKELLGLINAQWDAGFKPDYGFLRSEKDRIYIISKDVAQLEFEKIKMNSLGLYFAEHKKGDLRLSIEGSQIIGPGAKKNVAEISREKVLEWLRGDDIKIDGSFSGFVIVKHNDYFFGTGKFRQGVLLNFVPKARRLVVSDLP